MGAVRQNLIFAGAILGALCASQMPEFAQQYRQRIGGAIEELQSVVADFDRDAVNNQLTRAQALDMHDRASEPLFRDRGRSMRTTIARLDTLQRQSVDFELASPLARPLVLTYSDPVTLGGAWRDFRPAVPITTAGLAWAGAGFAAAAVLLYAVLYLLRLAWRMAFARQPRAAVPEAQATQR